MRKFIIISVFLLSSLTCSAQFIGIGAQYTEGNNYEFATNLSYPVYHKANVLNTYISSGIDYTGGRSAVSGLNIKPISATTYFSEAFFNDHPFTVLLSCDAGYLFNFKHGKDGIVLTPNIYVDYKIFYIKAGYDFNVTGGEQQFFVRIGVGFGMSGIKMLAKTIIR